MSKILVTGASGFIGKALTERLLEEGYEVIGNFYRHEPEIKHERFKAYCADITSQLETRTMFTLFSPDVCFHCAAIADINYAREHLLETVKTNVLGAFYIAELCQKFNVALKHISTCCVYGNNHCLSDEEALTKPTEIYAYTKLASELIVKGIAFVNDFDYSILRYGTVYGPGMRKALAIYIFLEKALKNEIIPVHGDGAQTRHYIYIDDLVDATMKTLNIPIRGETINIAGKEELSVNAIVEKCIKLTNSKSVISHVKDRPGQIYREEIDISKAKKLLQWEPKVGFEVGLEKTLTWIKGGKN